MKLTNSNKNQSLFFDKTSNLNNAKISFDGYSISSIKYIENLSVVLDNQLSQQHHMGFVENKLCIALSVFCKLKYYVPEREIVQVYHVAHPYPYEAVLNWGITAKSYLKQIQALHNKLVKIV